MNFCKAIATSEALKLHISENNNKKYNIEGFPFGNTILIGIFAMKNTFYHDKSIEQ